MSDLPSTEMENPSTAGLDQLDTKVLLHRINDEDRRAAWAVEREIDTIGAAVDAIVARLRRGGRLHYFGAGTSGRTAFMDAAELPPTFSTAPDLVTAHIAGGAAAFARAVEGAEDDETTAREEIHAAGVSEADAVVAISASGRTPYVIAALEAARERRALTVAVTNNDGTALADRADIAVVLRTGPEALAGSTRMKAAVAQKMTLTMLSTAVMVRLGNVHGNLMVSLAPTNTKLRGRAERLTKALSDAEDRDVKRALDAAGYDVKTAVLMLKYRCDADSARARLARHHGSLRDALADATK